MKHDRCHSERRAVERKGVEESGGGAFKERQRDHSTSLGMTML
jgi:hypothetical protein